MSLSLMRVPPRAEGTPPRSSLATSLYSGPFRCSGRRNARVRCHRRPAHRAPAVPAPGLRAPNRDRL
jgi:hypothetical protein